MNNAENPTRRVLGLSEAPEMGMETRIDLIEEQKPPLTFAPR